MPQIATVAESPRLTLKLGTPNLPTQTIAIGSLADAVAAVRTFIREHDISASEYGGSPGRVERDGKPLCRVSYYGKLWKLDEQGRETYREMNEAGGVAP